MLRVTCLVPYPREMAGGQRFRFEQWVSLLPPGALDMHVRPLWDPTTYGVLYDKGHLGRKASGLMAGLGRRIADIARAQRADAIFVYREAFPLGPAFVEPLAARRVPLVYDFDDAVYLGDTSRANSFARHLKWPSKVARIVRDAAVVTAGNAHLASWAAGHASDVRVIPTTIDVERYRPPLRSPRRPGEMLRIGWYGSPTTSPHLRSVAGALRRALDELPVELVVVGDPGFRLPGAPRVTVRPWDPKTELAEVGAFDIGIMPLPDDEWSRAKCGFKALLYMSMGVPTVASPVGVNSEIIEHGRNGLLATAEAEWLESLGSLVDEGLRHRLAVAGRETVVERYSAQRWAPTFLEAIGDAVAKCARQSHRAP